VDLQTKVVIIDLPALTESTWVITRRETAKRKSFTPCCVSILPTEIKRPSIMTGPFIYNGHCCLEIIAKRYYVWFQYFVAYTAAGEFFLTDKKYNFSQQREDDGGFTPWKNDS